MMTNGPITTSEPRLASLDAYRGFVMIALAFRGFGLHETSKAFPESPVWQTIGYHFEHVPWVGCAFWDLIQPSFMFMVGVALPYSAAKRQALGDSWGKLWLQAWVRSFALILLGIGLTSNWAKQTDFAFMNVLTQIGLGYWALFLLWNRPVWLQLIVATLILGADWAWFARGPLPPADIDWSLYKMPANWAYLPGFEAHWEKHTNVAAEFDRWFLNLFPRPEPFVFNNGGYQTLNCIPSLVTMLAGLMTGEAIRRTVNRPRMFFGLLLVGGLLLAAGYGLNEAHLCPVVKRIWTPSWTLYSTGWTLLLLGGFYGVLDVAGMRWWAFPLVVAGMNSMALYLMAQLLRPWVLATLERHVGKGWMECLGTAYVPMVRETAVGLVFWLTVYWLYRQRVFLRV